jgi:hypothetical protein
MPVMGIALLLQKLANCFCLIDVYARGRLSLPFRPSSGEGGGRKRLCQDCQANQNQDRRPATASTPPFSRVLSSSAFHCAFPPLTCHQITQVPPEGWNRLIPLGHFKRRVLEIPVLRQARAAIIPEIAVFVIVPPSAIPHRRRPPEHVAHAADGFRQPAVDITQFRRRSGQTLATVP